MPSMHDKVAVVTGGMSGVGFGIAQEMVDAGATVVITDLDRAGLDDAVSELGPAGFGAGRGCNRPDRHGADDRRGRQYARSP